MEKQKSGNLFLGLCSLLVDVAPKLDTTTRSTLGWGEPEYPNEEDYD